MSMTLLAPDVLKNLFICIIVSLAEYQAGVAHVYTQSNHLSGNLDAELRFCPKDGADASFWSLLVIQLLI